MTNTDYRKNALEQRLAESLEEHQATYEQLGRALSAVEQLRLKRQIQALESEIEQIQIELKALSGRPGTPIISPQESTKQTTAQPAPIPLSEGEGKVQSLNQQVDFILITALAEEREAVLRRLPGRQKLPPSQVDTHIYYEAELPVSFPSDQSGVYRVIAMSIGGMGRVKAATATSTAITRWCPRYVLLVGIAGGVAAQGVQLGDILIANQIVDYELQKVTPTGPDIRWSVHLADERLWQACDNFTDRGWHSRLQRQRPGGGKPARHIGPIASGDKVISFEKVLERYRETWSKLIGVEMEAGGVATAAFQSSEKPGFFMIRCVSDLADEHKGTSDVEKWRSYACNAAASFTIAFLKSGPVPFERKSTV